MNEKYPLALPRGTVLAGQYIIEDVLGQGGFGITYLAKDHKSGSKVAVKEFFPDSLAARTSPTTVSAFTGPRGEDFSYGKKCFLEEAETLAKFIGNDNIVRVHSYFEENGTAYFVMDYVEGISFAEYIRHYGGSIPFEKAVNVLVPIMDALGAVHNQGIIHRDVTPDNIYINNDGIVKLMDFGAARYSLGDKSQSLDVVLKHGYAPKEQYMRRGRQGPFTDIYSLGACFYFSVTGKLPPDSVDRLDTDEIVPMSALGADLPEVSENAIMKALSVKAEDRFSSMEDFKLALFGRAPAGPPEPAAVKQRYFTAPDDDGKEQFRTVLMDKDQAAGQEHFEKRPNDHIRKPASDKPSAARGKKKGAGILGGPPVLYILIACASVLICLTLIITSHIFFKTESSETASENMPEAAADEKTGEVTEAASAGEGTENADTEAESASESAASGSAASQSAADTKGKAQLGIMGTTVTDEMMEKDGTPAGAYVSDVLEGEGAEKAGLQRGDIITKVNGRNIPSMETLIEEIGNYGIGDTVSMTIYRPGENGYEEMELSVTLTAKEEA